MTQEQIINQVEPNGELLTTDMAIAAMDIWGLQQATEFLFYCVSRGITFAGGGYIDYEGNGYEADELYNNFLEQK